MREEKSRVISVSFFKGVAIAMVVLVHYAQSFVLPDPLVKVAHFGQMGCQIFFVLSAFTLCLSFQKKPLHYVQFMKRRVLKIAVGYWMAIIMYIGIAFVSTGVLGYNITGSDTSFLDIVFNVMLLNGIIPTAANNHVVRGGWFIGTIVIFYSVFIGLFKLYFQMKKGLNKNVCRFLFILLPLIMVNIIYYSMGIQCENNSFAYFNFINQLPCLAVGFVLYDLYVSGDIKLVRFAAIKGTIFIIASFGMFNITFSQNTCIFPTVFSLGFMYLFIFTENLINKRASFTIVRGFSSAGNNSFGIYLMHPFVVYEFMIIGKKVVRFIINCNDIVLFFILISIAYIISYATGKIFCQVEQKIRIKLSSYLLQES